MHGTTNIKSSEKSSAGLPVSIRIIMLSNWVNITATVLRGYSAAQGETAVSIEFIHINL